MKRLGWSNTAFERKNKVVVAVAKRFEWGPIESRDDAFPDVFSTTNGRFKGMESRSEPRVRFRLAIGEFGNNWCMFVK